MLGSPPCPDPSTHAIPPTPHTHSCILRYSTKSLDQQNKGLNTALHLAARIGDLKMLRLLLDHGANVTLRNEGGQVGTPMR